MKFLPLFIEELKFQIGKGKIMDLSNPFKKFSRHGGKLEK